MEGSSISDANIIYGIIMSFMHLLKMHTSDVTCLYHYSQ